MNLESLREPIVWLGLAGSATLITAYWCADRWARRSAALVNIVGAAMLGIACYVQDALPALLMEVFWIGVSVRKLAAPVRPAPERSAP
jgi:hypothetical protein